MSNVAELYARGVLQTRDFWFEMHRTRFLIARCLGNAAKIGLELVGENTRHGLLDHGTMPARNDANLNPGSSDLFPAEAETT